MARTIEASGGPEALEAMPERLHGMVLTVANDPDEYQDPETLQADPGALAVAAGQAWNSGDPVEAGQLAVLGEQRILQSQVLDPSSRAWHARLRVRLGASALEAGKLRQAVHFPCLAKWWSLKAVVGPGQVSEAELRYMVRLAQRLLVEARDAVGPNPTVLQEALLKRASRLIRTGTRHILDGNPRGLGPVWLGSVICYFLLLG